MILWYLFLVKTGQRRKEELQGQQSQEKEASDSASHMGPSTQS